jgi:hypothetical protein
VNSIRSFSLNPFLVISILCLLLFKHSFAQETELIRFCQENRFNPIDFSMKLKGINANSPIMGILKVYEKSLNGNYKGFIHDAAQMNSIKNRAINNPFILHLKQLEVCEYFLLKGEFNSAKKGLERAVSFARTKRENPWVSQAYRLYSKVYLYENKKDSADLQNAQRMNWNWPCACINLR